MRLRRLILCGTLSLALLSGVGQPGHASWQEAETLVAVRLRDEAGDRRILLEIREVTIDGEPIKLDEPVHANPDWLRRLTIRVRNVSGRPLVHVGIGVGLLPRVGDRLAAGMSWQYALVYSFGTRLPKAEAQNAPLTLGVGEDVVLTAANIDPVVLKLIDDAGGSDAFRQLEVTNAGGQYANGRSAEGDVVDTSRMKRADPDEQPN